MAPAARSNRAGVSLLEAGYAPRTVARYRRAVMRFLDTLNDDADFFSYEDLDCCVSKYLQTLFARGGARSLAADTLHGLMMYLPHAKGRLLICARMVRNWHRLEPSVPYPPLPYDACVAVALVMAARGRKAFGIATLLAFDCYLRVSELTSIRREDVAITGPVSEAGGVVLRLARTKTGREQSVIVEDPAVARLLTDHLRSVPRLSHVFPFSPDRFRRQFKMACTILGLQEPYVPHSLRHGGATRSYLRGVDIERVMQRGRWRSAKSARHYIQAGRALLVRARLPKMVSMLADVARGRLVEAMNDDPLTQQHSVGVGGRGVVNPLLSSVSSSSCSSSSTSSVSSSTSSSSSSSSSSSVNLQRVHTKQQRSFWNKAGIAGT